MAKKKAGTKKKGRTKKVSAKKTGAKKRGSGKRELIENRAGAFYGRRTGSGQFSEMDERGRSLAADRRKKAKTIAKKIKAQPKTVAV